MYEELSSPRTLHLKYWCPDPSTIKFPVRCSINTCSTFLRFPSFASWHPVSRVVSVKWWQSSSDHEKTELHRPHSLAPVSDADGGIGVSLLAGEVVIIAGAVHTICCSCCMNLWSGLSLPNKNTHSTLRPCQAIRLEKFRAQYCGANDASRLGMHFFLPPSKYRNF